MLTCVSVEGTMSTVMIGPRKPLYEKTYGGFHVSVYTLTKHRIIVYAMSGYIMPESTNAYIDDLLACARAEKPLAMIADPRAMKVLSKEFQTAVQTRFWPELARIGVKKNPALVPEAAITAQSVNRMVRTAGETVDAGGGRTLQIAMFSSLDDCVDWILRPDLEQKSS
jgi:hypothetical protein